LEYVIVAVIVAYWARFADVAHPLLMAEKSTMPAFFDGKYVHASPARPVPKRAQYGSFQFLNQTSRIPCMA